MIKFDYELANVDQRSIDFSEQPFRLGHWKIYPNLFKIENEETAINLPHKLMTLLILLARNYGQVVSRSTLHEQVWPDTIVSDESINRAIADLRKLLGDNAKKPTFIATVSKHGYQLISEPVALKSSSTSNAIEKTLQPKNQLAIVVLVSLVVAAMVIVGIRYLSKRQSDSTPTFNALYKTPLLQSNAKSRRPRIDKTGRFAVSQYLLNESSSIVMHDLIEGEMTHLISSTDYLLERPVISTSGEFMAFVRRSPTSIEETNNCKIMTYNFKTKLQREITDCASFFSINLDWAIDDSYLISTIFEPDINKAAIVKVDLNSGRTTTFIKPNENYLGYLFPRLSQSGNKIAFVSFNSQTLPAGIGIFDLETEKITFYNYDDGSDQSVQQVVWGNDDDTIYVSTIRGKQPGIWQHKLSSGEKTLLFNQPIVDFDANESAQIMIASFYESRSDIWMVDFTDKSDITQRPVISNKLVNTRPAINADGRYLAYNAQQQEDNLILVHDLLTDTTVKIAEFESVILHNLDWSPHENTLAFLKNSEENSELVVIDLLKPKQPMFSIIGVARARWSQTPGKMFVSFQDPSRKGIYELALATGTFTKLIPGAYNDFAQLSSTEFIVQHTVSGMLYKAFLDLQTNTWKKSLFIEREIIMNWKVANNTVLALIHDGRSGEFHQFDLQSGALLRIVNDLVINDLSASFSVDQRAEKVIYSKQVDPGNDLFLLRSTNSS